MLIVFKHFLRIYCSSENNFQETSKIGREFLINEKKGCNFYHTRLIQQQHYNFLEQILWRVLNE